jgi:hypothetical protein
MDLRRQKALMNQGLLLLWGTSMDPVDEVLAEQVESLPSA